MTPFPKNVPFCGADSEDSNIWIIGGHNSAYRTRVDRNSRSVNVATLLVTAETHSVGHDQIRKNPVVKGEVPILVWQVKGIAL